MRSATAATFCFAFAPKEDGSADVVDDCDGPLFCFNRADFVGRLLFGSFVSSAAIIYSSSFLRLRGLIAGELSRDESNGTILNESPIVSFSSPIWYR